MSKKLALFLIPLLCITGSMPLSAMEPEQATVETAKALCKICYDLLPGQEFMQLSCSHQYCKHCLTDFIRNAVQYRQLHNIRCPDWQCRPLTDTSNLLQLLSPEQRNQVNEMQTQEWLARQANVKHCPTPDCPYAFINDSTCQFQHECPKCNKTYCVQCMINHPGHLSCQEAQERYVSSEEQATRAWKERNSKPCPNCHAPIEKNYGCDHMTCKQCHYEFCWKCLGNYNNHFSCQSPVNQRIPRIQAAQNEIPDIEVYADMPRDFAGFGQMLSDAGIRVTLNLNGTITITARMHPDEFNRILDHANLLFR